MINLMYLDDIFEVKMSLMVDDLQEGILGTVDIETYQPDFNLTNWYLIKEDNKALGVFVIREFSNLVVSFHLGIYKKYRHQRTPQILKECLKLVKDKFNCKVITTVSSKNIKMLKVLARLDFKQVFQIKEGCLDADLCILAESEV